MRLSAGLFTKQAFTLLLFRVVTIGTTFLIHCFLTEAARDWPGTLGTHLGVYWYVRSEATLKLFSHHGCNLVIHQIVTSDLNALPTISELVSSSHSC